MAATTTIRLSDRVECDLTVTYTPKGPRVLVEQGGLKLSFTIQPASARLLIAALQECL